MPLLQVIAEIAPRTNAEIYSDIAIRFLINIISVIILVRFVYFSNYKRSDLFFTFFGFNAIIFFISFLLNKVNLSMGAAFGLFAVFSMLRYRTENISIKDMSYLFLVIAIGLISAVTIIRGSGTCFDYCFSGAINIAILIGAILLENNKLVKKESSHIIVYDNLQFVNPEKRKELIEDIKLKTGITPHKIIIQKVNITKGTSEIKIFYYED